MKANNRRDHTPYAQINYRTLGASGVRRVAVSPLPFFMKNRLIVFERVAAANARLSNRARQSSLAQGRRAQRSLTAVEFVLPFTPRLVGKNAGVHPAARGIVLLRSAYPQPAATMRWWIFLDDFVQYGSSSFDAMSDRQKRGRWTNTRSRGLPSTSRRRRLHFARAGLGALGRK